MSPQLIAQVKACRGVYSVRATATYFGIAKSSVSDIWQGRYHKRVMPATEEPCIYTKPTKADLIEDLPIALERTRGRVVEAAEVLGVSKSTVYQLINEEGMNVACFG